MCLRKEFQTVSTVGKSSAAVNETHSRAQRMIVEENLLKIKSIRKRVSKGSKKTKKGTENKTDLKRGTEH